MTKIPVKLYGTERCHKTQFYKTYFKKQKLNFSFLDVEENETYAKELRNLYENGKLNFPTITLAHKKLRNPSIQEIEKWMQKLQQIA